MAEPQSLTREDLDRIKLHGPSPAPISLSCSKHPDAAARVFYADGHLRLQCISCGFDFARVKVALGNDGSDDGGLEITGVQVRPLPAPGVCRECGCTQDRACTHEEHGSCSWAEPDLCSACTPDAGEGWEHPPPLRELGRLCPPYGGVERCAADICKSPQLNEETGAYMYRDLEGGKLVVFCGDCARYVELNRPERFRLVAL